MTEITRYYFTVAYAWLIAIFLWSIPIVIIIGIFWHLAIMFYNMGTRVVCES